MSESGGTALTLYDDPAASPPPGKHFLIPGPSGVLEALLDMPGTPHATGAPIAVVCHPHPLYGGSLTNKVAHTVARAFASMGAQTLRFNFRGVGESMGSFDEGRGEVDDLLAAEAWLRVRRPGAPLWLAGFSFGAFVALSGHVRAGAQSLLLVAPPVAMFDFPAESGVSIPWLVIQGSDDEVVDPAQVSAWARQQVNPPEFICLDGAGHFFHRRLIDLRDQIQAHWPPQ